MKKSPFNDKRQTCIFSFSLSLSSFVSSFPALSRSLVVSFFSYPLCFSRSLICPVSIPIDRFFQCPSSRKFLWGRGIISGSDRFLADFDLFSGFYFKKYSQRNLKIDFFQKADLTRLSYTLSHVPNLHWIVVEDSEEISNSVEEILHR